jgi:RimJ/RimL family protein N-acetyltransferase
VTPASFKRSIRDLQVWCSSCMVAFAGADPIGVFIGAKRPSGTLIHRIAVHPDHLRQGHGRHLLTSLSSKLAILGPPRIVAEVPDALDAARALFGACGYVEEGVLTDYVLAREANADVAPGQAFLIPVTVDDLVANGLLGPPSPGASAGQGQPQVCWERSVETLTARKDEILGLAVASDERIEAYLLHTDAGEIVALRSCLDDEGARLRPLVAHLRGRGEGTFRLAKVHPAELSHALLEALGFRPAGTHVRYTTTARSA